MTFEQHYKNALRERGFDSDPAQLKAVAGLTRIGREIQRNARGNWFTRRFGSHEPVRGLYLWGGVGRGKTFVMDLFHAWLDRDDSHRSHFHRFMQELHDALKSHAHTEDPLRDIAAELASRYRLLCFDEFYVSDIADAMLLGRLFERLFANGVTLIATSNVPPSELYRDGLQRARFVPAIDAIEAHCDVVHVDGDTDYRLRALAGEALYLSPNDAAAERTLAGHFERLSYGSRRRRHPLSVQGRELPTRECARGVVWFEFDVLCGGPRSQNDYIELARRFQTVIVSNVPQFDVTLENEARRFIALVDEFYDRRVHLIVSAAVDLGELYRGEKLQFEFERTTSRLIAMQSADYLGQPHRG